MTELVAQRKRELQRQLQSHVAVNFVCFEMHWMTKMAQQVERSGPAVARIQQARTAV